MIEIGPQLKELLIHVSGGLGFLIFLWIITR